MPMSGKEMVKAFERAGWKILRQKGSHVIMGKGSRRVTIPLHGNKDLGTGLERKLLKLLAEG
jgi:predicted RNA binding protein YcfA (HicA-like mRNA interferase family)